MREKEERGNRYTEAERERKDKDRRKEIGKKGEIDTQRQKRRKSEKRELGQIYIKEG